MNHDQIHKLLERVIRDAEDAPKREILKQILRRIQKRKNKILVNYRDAVYVYGFDWVAINDESLNQLYEVADEVIRFKPA